MSTGKLRLSPSGPVVTNGDGASGEPLVPGPGMQIRLNERKATCGGSISSSGLTELGGGQLRARLANPARGYKYKASAQVNSICQVNGEAITVRGELQVSYDGETTWKTVVADLFQFGSMSGVYRMAVVNKDQEVGGSFAWDMPDFEPDDPTAAMAVRCMLTVLPQGELTTIATMPTFQGLISLYELF